eukprot:1133710-Prorocentrum_minimum.AAC.1
MRLFLVSRPDVTIAVCADPGRGIPGLHYTMGDTRPGSTQKYTSTRICAYHNSYAEPTQSRGGVGCWVSLFILFGVPWTDTDGSDGSDLPRRINRTAANASGKQVSESQKQEPKPLFTRLWSSLCSSTYASRLMQLYLLALFLLLILPWLLILGLADFAARQLCRLVALGGRAAESLLSQRPVRQLAAACGHVCRFLTPEALRAVAVNGSFTPGAAGRV